MSSHIPLDPLSILSRLKLEAEQKAADLDRQIKLEQQNAKEVEIRLKDLLDQRKARGVEAAAFDRTIQILEREAREFGRW